MMLCWNSNVTSVGFAEFAAYPIAIPITAKNNNIIKIFFVFLLILITISTRRLLMKKNISHKSATSNQEIIDSCDFLSNAASTQDCTGLIPSGPMNEDELESYEAVYHYQPPRLSHKSTENMHDSK